MRALILPLGMATLLFLAAPAASADLEALSRQAKDINEIGKSFDQQMKRSWSLFPKYSKSESDGILVNMVSYLTDLGGSWTYQLRQGVTCCFVAKDVAVHPQNAERLLGVLWVSLKNAEKYFNLLDSNKDKVNSAQNADVKELMQDFFGSVARVLDVIKRMQLSLGKQPFAPVNSKVVSRCQELSKRAALIDAKTDGLRKAIKTTLEIHQADEIFLQSIYCYGELSIAAETATYAILFPKQVSDQVKYDKFRNYLAMYVTHIQRDIDKFHNRLERNVSNINNPELKAAHSKLLELNTSVQSLTIDLMKVVTTGQDPPAGAQEQGDAASKPARKPEKPAQPNDTPKWDIEGIKPRGL